MVGRVGFIERGEEFNRGIVIEIVSLGQRPEFLHG